MVKWVSNNVFQQILWPGDDRRNAFYGFTTTSSSSMLKMTSSTTGPLAASHSFLALYPSASRRTPSPKESSGGRNSNMNGGTMPSWGTPSTHRYMTLKEKPPMVITGLEHSRYLLTPLERGKVSRPHSPTENSSDDYECYFTYDLNPNCKGDDLSNWRTSSHSPSSNSSKRRIFCSADVLSPPCFGHEGPQSLSIHDVSCHQDQECIGTATIGSNNVHSDPNDKKFNAANQCTTTTTTNLNNLFSSISNKITPQSDIVFKFEEVFVTNGLLDPGSSSFTGFNNVTKTFLGSNNHLDVTSLKVVSKSSSFLTTPSNPRCISNKYNSSPSNSSASNFYNSDSYTSASSSPSEPLSFRHESQSLGLLNDDLSYLPLTIPLISSTGNLNNNNSNETAAYDEGETLDKRRLLNAERNPTVSQTDHPRNEHNSLALANLAPIEDASIITQQAGPAISGSDGITRNVQPSTEQLSTANTEPTTTKHLLQSNEGSHSSIRDASTSINRIMTEHDGTNLGPTHLIKDIRHSITPKAKTKLTNSVITTKKPNIKFVTEPSTGKDAPPLFSPSNNTPSSKNTSSTAAFTSSITSMAGSKKVPLGGVASNAVGLPPVRASTSSPSSRRHESQASSLHHPSTTQHSQINASAPSQQSKPEKKCCFCWCGCCKCAWGPGQDRKNSLKKRESTKYGSISMGDNSPLTYEEIKCWENSFDRLMKTTNGRNTFQDFLKHEYSEENMLFWSACEELKKETSQEAIEEKARMIYEDYISILSPKEVSLDSRVREIINQKMVEPNKDTFEEAQSQIYTLMHRDSYPRFLNSLFYRRLLEEYKPQTTTVVPAN